MLKFKRVLAFVLSIMLVLSMATEIPALAANVMTVDCANVLREVTHCANGSLYGMTESIPADGGNVIQWSSNNGYNQQWQVTAP
nr:hypothetical protein [uncultured Clostridium sp.]